MEIRYADSFWESCEKLGLKKPTGWSLKKIYWRLVSYDWRPGQIWYRLKCFCWHRYTTVRPRTLPYHTWCDRDELLLHCCFDILCKFLEKECSPGVVNWEADEYHRKAMKTMRELYTWWKEDYPDLDFNSIDDFKQVQKQLHRLVSIRKFMWT